VKEAARNARNTDRLAQLHPNFRERVARVITSLEDQGLRPRIQDAWRSPQDQRAAFEAGRSQLLYGFHNVTAADGTPEALAVDLLDDRHPLNPGKPYLLRLAAAAAAAGLVTGIRWGLPAKLVRAVETAIATADWTADVKIGWDPTHLEPVGVSVADARSGQRPA